MITLIRTATINEGKLPDGFGWAVKLTNYINENISGTNIQVVRNIGGQMYQVHWVANYESLAVLDEIGKTIEADAGYQELVAEARQQQLLVSSSIVDSLYESIS